MFASVLFQISEGGCRFPSYGPDISARNSALLLLAYVAQCNFLDENCISGARWGGAAAHTASDRCSGTHRAHTRSRHVLYARDVKDEGGTSADNTRRFLSLSLSLHCFGGRNSTTVGAKFLSTPFVAELNNLSAVYYLRVRSPWAISEPNLRTRNVCVWAREDIKLAHRYCSPVTL